MDDKINLEKHFYTESVENKPRVLQVITAIYVAIILGIFPIVFHDYYFDILIFKYRFYFVTSLVFFVVMFIMNIVSKKYNRENLRFFLEKRKSLTPSEISLLMFMVIAIVSTIQSDYRFESFWGNEGRYIGCFLLLICGISILIVSRTFKFNKWILDLFLFTGILICLFGITDYFKLDILKFKVNMNPGQRNIFVSTIGNINSYTSYIAMIMAVSSVLFSKERIFWKVILYYISMIISFFAIIMGISDNSYLALGALFAFLPLYIFSTRTGVKRYILMIASFSVVIFVMDFINKTIPDYVLEMDGILQKLSGYGKLEYIVVSVVALSILVYIVGHFRRGKEDNLGHKWQIAWLVFLFMATAFLAYVLYEVNILKLNRYGELNSYLLFNDDWGTHRGYIWRIGLENYSRFPMIHKIFGYGPDTYGLLTHFNNYNDMVHKYQEVFDSVHNEYLQYFITMGPFSLISYIAFLISSGVSMFRRSKGDAHIMAIFFAVICYAVQATVNISVPIVTPIMFTLLAIGLAGVREDTKLCLD
ncbi:O-Antigen ligase [Lacrimispora sphenoides]|jgi:hypothetical protein|uniref:O-antigen ligase family protein n=1 Tax=Lacrimispora sphenoides TaxID=29370 RepID=UPI0008C8FDCA|nr:O-antigen ligase family protein [Lacrimispora sphenoides]SET90376.1 O-Antigen ligase [Lacrimispora sphenoides]